MWVLLVIGALLAATVSRSPRESATPRRQLAIAPPPPGPIAVLGECVRIGTVPPPMVILCAIAEAEAIGREDLASDIIRVFVAPVVQQGWAPPIVPYAGLPYAAPSVPPRRAIPAAFARESCAMPMPMPSRSPRDRADAVRLPAPVAPTFVPQRVPAALGQRSATDDEIRAMLNADPEGFIAMATRARMIEVPIEPARQAIALALPSSAPDAVSAADALADQLIQMPGHSGAGVVLDPSSGAEIFEVRWLRGYPIPALPQSIADRSVQLVIVDALAEIQQPQLASTGLPSEMVAELQEAAGLHEAADQTRALVFGSPIASVPDDAWREFVVRLEREPPQFISSRHVGQYRQCRDRLAELGIDPQTLVGSAQAQRAALDVDLADAYQHATAGDLLTEHVGRTVVIPGRAAAEKITLSGVLGVIQCAGLDNAVGWLERPGDRKRFPYTSQVFTRTNGVF